jgi:hypothetical protein
VKDSSTDIEKSLGGSKCRPGRFEKEEEISFSRRDSSLASTVIRGISIRIDLGWISQIVKKLVLFIEDMDIFNKFKKKSSEN